MKLWVRTQDREELLKINRLFITKYNNWEIVADMQEEGTLRLGEYTTKERALQVLDEIQRLLKPRIMLKYNDDFSTSVSEIEQQPNTYVYEMPEN